MILDKRALFSDEQAIVASAASTNIYDFGVPGTIWNGDAISRHLGKGNVIPLLVQVTENFNTLTSLTIGIETDEDVAFGSAKVVASFSVVLADLVAGYKIPLDKLPRNITERYMRINYTVVGANPTLGKISAGFVGAVDEAYQG